jgi:hypothetical protein
MNNDTELYFTIHDAEILLSELKHNISWRPNSTQKLNEDKMQKIKELVTKAELLLLNKPTGAITETAHCANTNVGRSADSSTDTHIGGIGAGSSETSIVGQNEQEREFCDRCGQEMFQRGIFILCQSCDDDE